MSLVINVHMLLVATALDSTEHRKVPVSARFECLTFSPKYTVVKQKIIELSMLYPSLLSSCPFPSHMHLEQKGNPHNLCATEKAKEALDTQFDFVHSSSLQTGNVD